MKTRRMLSDEMIAAYLDRICARKPDKLDLDALRHLHERHVLSVPFESIDYHLGKEIYYRDKRVVRKIVEQRRGGGCGEINTAFYFLLESLGFAVTVHHARVRIGRRLADPYNHLMVTALIDGTQWVVDPGFGRGPRYPVKLDSAEPQSDPHGVFATRRPDDRWVEVLRDGKPQYRFHNGPADLADFEQVLWWYRTSPDSTFMQNLFCSLPLDDGSVLLKDDVLTITQGGETRTEKLGSDEAVLAAYEKWFGMKLAERPRKSRYFRQNVQMAFEER